MNNTSTILTTVRTNICGVREAVNYEWQGKSPYVQISGNLLCDIAESSREPKIRFGPYLLLFVDRYPEKDISLYVRSDKLGKLRVFLYQSSRWLDLIYRRILITLAVWELAEFHANRVSTIQDVYLVQKIIRLWNKYAKQ